MLEYELFKRLELIIRTLANLVCANNQILPYFTRNDILDLNIEDIGEGNTSGYCY